MSTRSYLINGQNDAMRGLRNFRNPSGAKALVFSLLFGTASFDFAQDEEAVPFRRRQSMGL